MVSLSKDAIHIHKFWHSWWIFFKVSLKSKEVWCKAHSDAICIHTNFDTNGGFLPTFSSTLPLKNKFECMHLLISLIHLLFILNQPDFLPSLSGIYTKSQSRHTLLAKYVFYIAYCGHICIHSEDCSRTTDNSCNKRENCLKNKE